jgi:iron complex outermembrane receptor protein
MKQMTKILKSLIPDNATSHLIRTGWKIPVFVFVILIMSSSKLIGQGTIYGYIYSSYTRKPLVSASVVIHGLNIGCSSDISGYYKLTGINPGKYSVRVSYVGYRDTSLIANISGTETIRLDFYLSTAFIELQSIFVTANRKAQNINDIPASITVIKTSDIQNFPAYNADDILEFIPGANIDRDNGIFSKNASITLRGLNSTARTLVLLDGVPLNKTDGGGINWNRIDPETIERIEVVKGPVSPVYGNNAMAGVINIITSRPEKPLEGLIKGFAGTYGTSGFTANISGLRLKKPYQGFYWGIHNFFRGGAGYILAPDSTRDSLDVKAYLKEINSSVKMGYKFSERNYTQIEYSYYDDKRGDGTRIYESEGGYNKYRNNSLSASLHFNNIRDQLHAVIFYNIENYYRQSETRSQKNSGKYTLYNTDADRMDMGIWLNYSRKIMENQSINIGLDLKQGNVDASDIYKTSTDILTNKGVMNFAALFGIWEMSLLENRLNVNASLRYDYAKFFDASFIITEPTTLTAFMAGYPDHFENATWHAVSPKISAGFQISKALKLYLSYAHGFRAPMLDDMCRNGNISKGFKLANPFLKPEHIDNYEIGSDLALSERIIVKSSIYYSVGNDFQYFVGTGDSITTTGDNLKPVLKRENIGKVKITGAEITINYKIISTVDFFAGYAYNHSIISEFMLTSYTGKDLTGKYLMEVAPNQAFSKICWRNSWVPVSVTCNLTDTQWNDDENTISTPGYYQLDAKLLRNFGKHCTASLIIKDLLDMPHIDSKGNISPGRFFMCSISYNLNI